MDGPQVIAAAGFHYSTRLTITKLRKGDLVLISPTVPRKFRMGFRNRRALAAQVARLQAWPVQRLVMAHGPIVQKGAADTLRRPFSWVKL